MIICLKLFFKMKHCNLFQNPTYSAASVMTELSLTLCTFSKWKFFFPFDGNILWHTWHCCWVLLMTYTISLDFTLSTWVAMCRHVWLTDRLLLPQTKHVQLRMCLLRRCSTSSLGDWTSSPHSLHSIPLLSADGSGTECSASRAWETEHSRPSTQSLTSEKYGLYVWHLSTVISNCSRYFISFWT